MSRQPYTAGYRVWLEKEGVCLIGSVEAQILEGIQTLGSFMKTARALGISYAHAWNTVNRVEILLGEPIIEAKRGGESGGGAQLTKMGLKLLEDYKRLEEKVDRFLSATASSPIRRRRLLLKPTLPDLGIIGSDCIGIEILLNLLLEKNSFTYEVVHVGSAGGLAAVMLGECDIAGVHLLDEETGQYNLPFLRRYWISEKAVLVRGYMREQGLIIPKHNPKKVQELSDLLRRDLKFVNRNLGSGTRSLLDIYLRRLAQGKHTKFNQLVKRIRGYGFEVKSHTEVAEMVKQGRADVGFGIGTTAEKIGLEFIPIAEEQFDFVIEESRIDKPLVKGFIDALDSRRFHRILSETEGLHTTPETGRIVYRP